ncbi:Vanillin dehydrogenase [compost metagenome]
MHADLFDAFVEQAVALVGQYRLGRSDEAETTLGPLVRAEAAEFVRGQISEAVGQGAKAHLDPAAFPLGRPGSAYLAPQVLTNVHHGMRVMGEESFGPVVGIQQVRDDAEALALMNDSPYGLTAAIFSQDEAAALELADRVDAGTVFLNRCDYLDPALAWTGVKQSGRGCSLSRLGYEHLTRPKSFHFKTRL